MKIKRIRAKNFLCFGPEGIDLDLEKHSNIVQVKGRNCDVGENSSVGSGKSSLICDTLSYGFYGKTIKNLSHKEAINGKIQKSMEVDIEVDNYRIVRKRKPDNLLLYEILPDGTEKNITLGGMPATQEFIEQQVLKVNFNAFINIVCFGEHNNHFFLAATKDTRRQIIDNLLSLEKYAKYAKICKDQRRSQENSLEINAQTRIQLDKELIKLDSEGALLATKRNDWITYKKARITQAEVAICTLQKQTGQAVKIDAYVQAQKRAKDLEKEITDKRIKLADYKKMLELSESSYSEKNSELREWILKETNLHKEQQSLIFDLGKNTEVIKNMSRLQDGVKCERCFSTITKSNYGHYLDECNIKDKAIKDKVSAIGDRLQEHVNIRKQLEGSVKQFRSGIQKLEERIRSYQQETQNMLVEVQTCLETKRPELDGDITGQIKILNDNIAHWQEELNQNPFDELILNTETKVAELEHKINVSKTEAEEFKEDIKYWNYWIKAFGDEDGIRAFIIDRCLPVINRRINYWLNILINGKLKLEFDRNFDVFLNRNLDEEGFVYNGSSGGEKRLIDLALSQSFSYLMMLSNNVVPSMVSLDEIGLNVDARGMNAIYQMILEMSKERQVFVTTHDSVLQDLLQNHECIYVMKKDGFSKLVSKEEFYQ